MVCYYFHVLQCGFITCTVLFYAKAGEVHSVINMIGTNHFPFCCFSRPIFVVQEFVMVIETGYRNFPLLGGLRL